MKRYLMLDSFSRQLIFLDLWLKFYSQGSRKAIGLINTPKKPANRRARYDKNLHNLLKAMFVGIML